eukprot:TRINITY_DN16083_c0_g1_i1.p1 TRINITY_DN16083_c0_g1~~TRINITY_DN16083_c0_g1_i1.p1  ORF type:complete len:203 (-),score=29.18 TRINITY_DN16083_c0_g1_i1:129-695(-)
MASLVAATGDQGLCLPSGIHEGALSSAATFLETIPGGISRRGAVSSSTAFLEAVPRGGAVSSSSSAFLGTVPRGHVRLVGRAASFFDSADLAPPLGLPPPEGWGEGNDSECMTCACDSKLATGEKLQEKHQKLVFPNVPHHSFFPHGFARFQRSDPCWGERAGAVPVCKSTSQIHCKQQTQSRPRRRS